MPGEDLVQDRCESTMNAILNVTSSVPTSVPSQAPALLQSPSRSQLTQINKANATSLEPSPFLSAPLQYLPFPAYIPHNSRCFNTSTRVNRGGKSGRVFFYRGSKPVNVMHKYEPPTHGKPIIARGLEELNLWMSIDWHGPRYYTVAPGNSTPHLVYIPGRTIAFDDYEYALEYMNISTTYHESYRKIPHGGGGEERGGERGGQLETAMTKLDGMKMLTETLSPHFETLIFLRHLDPHYTCKGHCCPNGSNLVVEFVGLRGWNRSTCPGHVNLSWSDRACDCTRSRFC